MNFTTVFRDQYTKLPISLTEDAARHGTYIVTGSNTGLGYECVKTLTRLRAGRIILAVRNTKAGLDAVRTIEKEVTGDITTKLEVWELDLARFASVKAFAQRVEANLDRVDALIQNAALAAVAWEDGEDGWDRSMTVNVVSTMLLAILLLPHLRATGKAAGVVPRIAIIGSGVAFMPGGKKCFDELEKSSILEDMTNRKKWEPLMADFYPCTKLLLFLCYRGLAEAASPKDGSGAIITYINPGICYTNLNRNAPTFHPVNIQVVVGRVLMGRSAEMGSRTLIHGAVAEEACHGTFTSECQPKDHYVPNWVNNELGRRTTAQCWKEMQSVLDGIVPGCVDKVIRFKR